MVSILQLQDVLESIATMQKAFLRELTPGRSEKDQELLVGKLTVLNIVVVTRIRSYYVPEMTPFGVPSSP